MKDCTQCRFADWKRTKAGKLHPSGDGRCKFQYSVPELPASMFWFPGKPEPKGGQISRKRQLHRDCAAFLPSKP